MLTILIRCMFRGMQRSAGKISLMMRVAAVRLIPPDGFIPVLLGVT